ncbi:extracellular solute-binding protein [Streptomyces sp. NPDC046900]|uniref:ABC transporter substrate-binding protein n=1 Tax=Streptomyces sp. NPDC046900 TaxID=3155473 RepID=UPI0033ED5F57
MRVRTIEIAAGAVIGALALSGCGSSGGSGGSGAGKTITVYTSTNGQYATQQRQWFKAVSAAFEKQTGTKVNFETYSSGDEELTKIQTSVVANQGPDIFDIGTTFTPTAYATGAFAKLTAADWAKLGGKSKFIPATLGISGPDATHQIGVPWTSQPYVLAYNTQLLSKAGIAQPATTWDGLAQQAKQLTGNGVYGIATGYKDGFLPWKFVWAMDEQAGHPLVAGQKADINSPSTAAAYQAYFGWLTREHAVDPASIGWNDDQALAAFASGKAAFYPMTSTTAIPTFDQSAVKGKYKFALLPTVPPGVSSMPAGGKPVASMLSGENLVVAQYSQNKDLDLQLIKFLTDPAQQKIQYSTFGEMPVNQSSAQEIEKTTPAVKPIVDAEAGSYSTPFTGAWGQIELGLVNIVVQSIPELSSGGVRASTLAQQLGAAQKDAQSALNGSK